MEKNNKDIGISDNKSFSNRDFNLNEEIKEMETIKKYNYKNYYDQANLNKMNLILDPINKANYMRNSNNKSQTSCDSFGTKDNHSGMINIKCIREKNSRIINYDENNLKNINNNSLILNTQNSSKDKNNNMYNLDNKIGYINEINTEPGKNSILQINESKNLFDDKSKFKGKLLL